MYPIVGFSTIISDEVISPDDIDDFDPVDMALELLDKWFEDGAADSEYYYAVFLLPAGETTYGAAVMGYNMAVGIVDDENHIRTRNRS